jgi:hypothetical protein
MLLPPAFALVTTPAVLTDATIGSDEFQVSAGVITFPAISVMVALTLVEFPFAALIEFPPFTDKETLCTGHVSKTCGALAAFATVAMIWVSPGTLAVARTCPFGIP